MFFRIDDPKKREQIVNELLKNRSIIKKNNEKERQFNMGYREESEKLFKPITETISEQNIVHKKELNALGDRLTSNQGKIYQKIAQIPAITGPKQIQVSQLIQKYLSDNNPKERSNAIYSIRYNTESNTYSIGNSFIKFDNNAMEIADKKYEATKGLMELLTKKDPDLDKCIEEDYDDYKEILLNTNAIYQNADPNTRKLASDRSEKWKLIKEQLLSHLFKKTGGKLDDKNITFLSSDPNSLVDQLKLSVASYNAGNNGEYNKINAILDELLKQKIITNNRYKKIHRNVFSS
jgi:hypothetical protein